MNTTAIIAILGLVATLLAFTVAVMHSADVSKESRRTNGGYEHTHWKAMVFVVFINLLISLCIALIVRLL